MYGKQSGAPARACLDRGRFRLTRVNLLSLAAGLCLAAFVAAGALTAHSLHGSGEGAPPGDFTLTVFAIGAWAGDFGIDAEGRGGLATLHTMVERSRRRHAVGGAGGVLLVQSGNFTGAESLKDFIQKLHYPELNLVRYLRLDALGPAAPEVAYHRASPARQAGFGSLPALSFNYRPATADDAPSRIKTPDLAVPAPFRIVRRSSYTTFITSVTSGAEPQFGTDPVELLHRELRRQNGIDLYILLLDRQPATAPEDDQDAHDLHPAPAQTKTRPAYLNGPELLEQPVFRETFFPVDPVAGFDPYSLPADDPFAQRWLIVESSAPANRFRRLPEGPYLCAVQDRTVCEITIEFRKHEIRGVRARFIDLNGARHPGSWIAPDPLLLEVLKKQA